MSTPLGRPPKYPWGLWTNGHEWVLDQGVDFDCTTESFGILARRQARIMGVKVHISRSNSRIWIRFELPEEEANAPDSRAS